MANLGKALIYMGNFLYLRTWLKIASDSICFGLSNALAMVYLKYLALGHLLFLLCANNLPRIFDLSLLPIYTGILSLSPKKYMPNMSVRNSDTFSRLNTYHLLPTGILRSFIKVGIIVAVLYFLVNTKISKSRCKTAMHEIYLSISVIFNQGKIRDTWLTSRALLCPLVMASSGELSR